MNSRKRRPDGLLVLAVAASLLLLAPSTGAKKRKQADRVTFSGFLGNYDELQPAEEKVGFLYGYTKRPGILREYDKAMIDPILVYFHPGSEASGFDPEKLYELTRFFRERVVEELSDDGTVEIVDAAGPGVMRVRIAITDIEVVKKGANIGAKTAGMALGVGFLVPAVDVGGATMECEVLDSTSGERLVAVVDRETGRRMMNFGSMKSMGDAKGAMKEWAQDFRKNIRRIHDGKLPKGVREPK